MNGRVVPFARTEADRPLRSYVRVAVDAFAVYQALLPGMELNAAQLQASLQLTAAMADLKAAAMARVGEG